jgi:hypothetical protein
MLEAINTTLASNASTTGNSLGIGLILLRLGLVVDLFGLARSDP